MSKNVLNLSSGFCLTHGKSFDDFKSKVATNEARFMLIAFLFQLEIPVLLIGNFAIKQVGRWSLMPKCKKQEEDG